MNQPFAKSGKINKGLVALDLTEMDKEILNYLKFFTQHVPTEEFLFFHVILQFDIYRSTYFPAYGIDTEPKLSNEDAIKALNKEIKNTFDGKQNIDFETDSTTGKPLEAILKKEESWHPDLLVIGDSNRNKASEIIKRNIVRKSQGAVLMIPEEAKTSLDHIMVPIDFSENSARALKAAVSMGKSMPTTPEIIALNVYDTPVMFPYVTTPDVAEPQEELEERIKAAMEQFIQDHAADYPKTVKTVIQQNKAPYVISDSILEAAQQNNAGLIVIGAKGHSFLDRLLIGSVTEKLLSSDQRVPVLIIK